MRRLVSMMLVLPLLACGSQNRNGRGTQLPIQARYRHGDPTSEIVTVSSVDTPQRRRRTEKPNAEVYVDPRGASPLAPQTDPADDSSQARVEVDFSANVPGATLYRREQFNYRPRNEMGAFLARGLGASTRGTDEFYAATLRRICIAPCRFQVVPSPEYQYAVRIGDRIFQPSTDVSVTEATTLRADITLHDSERLIGGILAIAGPIVGLLLGLALQVGADTGVGWIPGLGLAVTGLAIGLPLVSWQDSVSLHTVQPHRLQTR